MKNTYQQNPIKKSSLNSVEKTEGMTIETQTALYLNNQTDIEHTKIPVYTERRDGVMAGLDIRTDRWEVAIDAMDKSAKSMTAKRTARMNVVKDNEDGKTDSVQGTDNK